MTLEEYAKQQQQQQGQAQSEPQPERQKTKLESEQERSEQARQQALDAHKKYQLNIRKTETISTEIIKGLQKGESIASLFLKAVKAYTLCTGNNAEYNIIEETLQTVYGKALKEAGAAELEADAIRNKLEKLQAAYSRADNERDRSRLEQAIAAHKKELADLLTG